MLNKQAYNLNFSGGLDTKTDPFQVTPGKFLSLDNSVFTKAGLLQKRNGFGALSSLPTNTAQYLTTFNGGLTAVGSSIESLSSSTDLWTNKGNLQLAELNTLSLYRSSNNQSQCDAIVAPNGLVCTVYTDNPSSGVVYKYIIADSSTGQVIVNATTITASSGNTNSSPRVFVLGAYFIILFGTSTNHIQYLAISWSNPTVIHGPTDISTAYTSSSSTNFDGVVFNNNLYIAYNSVSGGQSIKIVYLNSNLITSATVSYTSSTDIATMFALAAEQVGNNTHIYVYFYNSGTQVGKVLVVDDQLNNIISPTTVITSTVVNNITAVAQNSTSNFYYEVANSYAYNSSVSTNYINYNTVSVSLNTAMVGTSSVILRSVGLASKAVLYNSKAYMLTAYESDTLNPSGSYSSNQSSYFLIDGSGNISCKLAYSNGGGYLTAGLPSLTLSNTTLQVGYLIKDFISSVNKGTNISGVPIAAIYAQTGISLASINLSPLVVSSAEIGGMLHISGGIVWAFDGASATEQGFNVWPDTIGVFTSTSGGNLTQQTYFYQVTYEWTDNNGNLYRSAPSIPVSIMTTGSSSTNTIYVPNLRLTYKTNVKIVVYRWSTAQQVYYSITSPQSPPNLSSTTTDYTIITDIAADSAIIGNPILYTTGGVLENIGAPPSNLLTLFDNRLFAVDAENPNLLWFSKQVIENTPVEMSDTLTLYSAPTTGAQGSTGIMTAIAPMDDKLIVFKKDAVYYVNGVGPDNTGANNQYSNFVFVSSVVGSQNQNSIIFIPAGLLFQSDKGIWLLSRNLGTTYLGAPVEGLTLGNSVESAITVPGTNQVRFTMNSGVTLMYDYYFDQWGSFINIPALSSTVYQGLHTYINNLGQVFQETPNKYLDGTNPVLMSFTTAWMSFAGIQGFERFYQMLLLGQYYTPFKLNVQFAFNYNPNPSENAIIVPSNFSPVWGGNPLWGSGSPWGGPKQVFEERVFPMKQKCETFQISINEIYDPSHGVQAGAGLTLSGCSLVVGVKKGYRTQAAARSV